MLDVEMGETRPTKESRQKAGGSWAGESIMTMALVPALVFMLDLKVCGKHGCPPGRDLLQLGLDGKRLQVGECQLC